MKIKISLIISVVIMAFAFTASIGFAHDKEKSNIEKLLTKRTDIMQEVLLNKITIEVGCNQLKDIEAGALYTEDCRVLSKYKNTDYDVVADMNIVSLEKDMKVSDVMTYKAKIEWTTYTYEGINTINLDHYIGIKEYEDCYKLVSFEAVADINLPL